MRDRTGFTVHSVTRQRVVYGPKRHEAKGGPRFEASRGRGWSMVQSVMRQRVVQCPEREGGPRSRTSRARGWFTVTVQKEERRCKDGGAPKIEPSPEGLGKT